MDNENFIIHYYLKDNSHSMDAFLRNRIEKDLLSAIKNIASILDIEIEIESKAHSEGGLIETFKIQSNKLWDFAKPIINDLIYIYIAGKRERIEEENKRLALDNQILEIKKQSKQIILQKDEIKAKIEISSLIQNNEAKRHISNYYKNIKSYEKIEKIGYKFSSDKEELIVERSTFSDFIIEDSQDKIIDESANIEIISPVLKEGNYKWRGKYLGETISFSMSDSSFRQEVISAKYEFANGTFINCCLEITTTLDETQEITRKSYKVLEVHKIQKDELAPLQIRKPSVKTKQKKNDDNEPTLFD